MPHMKIAVLFGGTSQERDVSIASAAQIIPALRGLGHEVISVDTVTGRLTAEAEKKMLTSGVGPEPPSTTALANLRDSTALALTSNAADIRDVDVVFLALHGGSGEDGRVQAVLDLAGMAYTGSNHIASAAAMDKDLSKRLFRAAGVDTLPCPTDYTAPWDGRFHWRDFLWDVDSVDRSTLAIRERVGYLWIWMRGKAGKK